MKKKNQFQIVTKRVPYLPGEKAYLTSKFIMTIFTPFARKLPNTSLFACVVPPFSPFPAFSRVGKFIKNFRSYSSVVEKRKVNTTLGKILDHLYNSDSNKKYLSNVESQTAIEEIVFDEYSLLFKNYKGYSSGDIDLSLLSPSINKCIIDKTPELTTNINNMKSYFLSENKKNNLDIHLIPFFEVIDVDEFLNQCLINFLRIVTNQSAAEDDLKSSSLRLALSIGNNIIKIYLYKLKCSTEENKSMKYSEWYNSFVITHKDFCENVLEVDSVIAKLGYLMLEALEVCGLVYHDVVTVSKDVKYQKYFPHPNIDIRTERIMLDFPLKLPMIVPPKPYSKGILGGYLLNDVKYNEELIIYNRVSKDRSFVENKNVIYNMINSISSTPYKINLQLLDYLSVDKHKLLLDKNEPSKYEGIKKKTNYQKAKHSGYVSKIVLQETILGIAEFFGKFPQIYFPVRMDTRGRIYCKNNYLNYQSSELAKALLLFAKPGIISKSDLSGIKYLEFYGVNCYGNSKISDKSKLSWIKKNLDNIINYDNGILLNKAEDKLLFLAFCMEYKRYIEFINDENATEFHTYLPVQLDATCNGFQHLALLSNENTIFKELNLVKQDEVKPRDFYNYLVHKLNHLFTQKISSGIKVEAKMDNAGKTVEGGSYVNLQDIVINRSIIKKAVMTIPYNGSIRSMIQYIKSNLYQIEDNKKDGLTWYSKSEFSNKPCINHKDISLLVVCIHHIVHNDFEKIKKLMKYLRNVATVLTLLGLPIIWSLPHGLTVKQSYLELKTTSIRPYMYSKTKINIQVKNKDKYDKNHQIRALMPNLIHSLDASSLALLFDAFHKSFEVQPQFLAIHDCFGTTFDKVEILKTILASVYMDLYCTNPYLDQFDSDVLYSIERAGVSIDKKSRTLEIEINGVPQKYELHSINWVKNEEIINKRTLDRIDSQYFLI